MGEGLSVPCAEYKEITEVQGPGAELGLREVWKKAVGAQPHSPSVLEEAEL